MTINRNLRLNLNISGAKFKKIKQGKFTKRSNKFELLENADIMRGGHCLWLSTTQLVIVDVFSSKFLIT